MCVIALCKIYTCQHLESIFKITDRCDVARFLNVRYCNRDCIAPTLIAESSPLECPLCSRTTGIRSPEHPLFLDLFRNNEQLLVYFRDQSVDRWWSPDWRPVVREALWNTIFLQSQGLKHFFPVEDPEAEMELIEWSDRWIATTPVEMEVLQVGECPEDCPGRLADAAEEAVQ